MAGGGEVTLVDLTKQFADVTAVDGIGLQVASGEFFSLLGPSGCGKTTTLRMIAGFETPTSGEIRIDGEDMAARPAHRRNVNTVFQSYALFPHLKVADNVAFGLKRAGVDRREVRRRVAEAVELVQLTGLERRKPAQLSGGQQQRVALARALVLKPAVVLLDEPLGALDAKLRRALQIELKALQEQIGLTFIYVTHDQEEALTMSDRLAVMHDGRIEQLGTPKEVYSEPSTTFVADFLGISNLMAGEAHGRSGDACAVSLGEFRLHAGARPSRHAGRRRGSSSGRSACGWRRASSRAAARTTACRGWSSASSTWARPTTCWSGSPTASSSPRSSRTPARARATRPATRCRSTSRPTRCACSPTPASRRRTRARGSRRPPDVQPRPHVRSSRGDTMQNLSRRDFMAAAGAARRRRPARRVRG